MSESHYKFLATAYEKALEECIELNYPSAASHIKRDIKTILLRLGIHKTDWTEAKPKETVLKTPGSEPF